LGRPFLIHVCLVAALIAAVGTAVSYYGREAIVSSEAFDLAAREVRARLGADGESDLKPWANVQFSEGEERGNASFTLVRAGRCFPVDLKKDAAVWKITSLREKEC
jgi:hypothetical protein